MVSPDRRLDEASAILAITTRLNQANTPPVQRVQDLLQKLYEADSRRRALAPNVAKLSMDHELRALRNDINAALSRYSWTPVVTSILNLTPVSAWSPAVAQEVGSESGLNPDPLMPLWAKIHGGKHGPDEEWEPLAIWYLVHRGHWLRYRRCKECNQWFYARTDFQTSCTTACRQKFAARDSEFKKKRAQYMKKRYHAQKEADRKAMARLARRAK